MSSLTLLVFPIIWLGALLGILLLRKGNPKEINKKVLALYISFMAMLGPVGEIVVGTFYEVIVGQPLWQYKIMPTHQAYTSLYAPVIWGISGAYLYYIHEILRAFSNKSKWFQAMSRMFETILVEALLNVSFLLLSGTLIFYYLPADLFHITSLQTLPFYFILGIVVMKSIKRFKADPVFYSLLSLSIMFVVVYLTS